MTDQRSTTYRGNLIVENQYHGMHQKIETMGFTVERVYVVTDELDQPALPLVQQAFWSPWEARRAIDFVEWAKQNVNERKWTTSIAHEYNVMVNYQRHFNHVYTTIQEVRKMCRSELEWGDNPAVKKILERLDYMHQECLKAVG
jgi:hypothetical protein